MRMTKVAIIVSYIMAAVALLLFVSSVACTAIGETGTATLLVAQGCFLLLLSIWANVCS